jgi:hypothetical protein
MCAGSLPEDVRPNLKVSKNAPISRFKPEGHKFDPNCSKIAFENSLRRP